MTVYLYAIRCHDFVKLGMAADPEQRCALLQVSNPYEMRVIWARPFATRSEAHVAERNVHARFEPFRERGEWFRLECVDLLEAEYFRD